MYCVPLVPIMLVQDQILVVDGDIFMDISNLLVALLNLALENNGTFLTSMLQESPFYV